jgi:O-antigen ligase
MSGSRSPLILPAVAIVIAKLITNNYSTLATSRQSQPAWPRLLAASVVIIAITLGSTQLWYRYSSEAAINRVSDTWRINTAWCWAKQPVLQGQPWLGLGHSNKIRNKCNSDRLPAMGTAVENSSLTKEQKDVARRAAKKGLPHAHNTYVQIFAETGLLGLSAIMMLMSWGARKVQRLRLRGPALKTSANRLILKASLPIAAYLSMTAATTSFHIYLPLNQILVGYLLASFSATADDQAASTLTTPAPRCNA